MDHTTDSTDEQTSAMRAAELFGDKLTHAIDAYAHEQTVKTTGDLCAELLGRVTSIVTAVELRIYAALEAARHGGA